MNSDRIGKAIRQLRQMAGYTQHELADCLHVTDQAVSKWERGLSVPDISIIMSLSNLLNCDVDNLLEGNITYLEQSWQGWLVLPEGNRPDAGTDVFGRPMIFILLSYFVLAGIRTIYVSCAPGEEARIRELIEPEAEYGFHLHFLSEKHPLPPAESNTMVVRGNVFVYGAQLTRYFQRAMSRREGVFVLTLEKRAENGDLTVEYDNHRKARFAREARSVCVPILFFPQRWHEQMKNLENLRKVEPLYAEPMDNGIIAYQMDDEESVLDTAMLFRYLRKRLGREAYDLKEVCRNRNLRPTENECFNS